MNNETLLDIAVILLLVVIILLIIGILASIYFTFVNKL